VDAARTCGKFAALAVADGIHELDEETFYQGITSLPPGSALSIQAGKEPRQTRYWRPTIFAETVLPPIPNAFSHLKHLPFSCGQ